MSTTPESKEFERTFDTLRWRHNSWTAWSDFIAVHACMISLAFDRTNRQIVERRAEELRRTRGKYTDQDLAVFDRLFKIVAESLERNPQQDFLGELYMSLDFGNQWQGQFFTPWSVAFMMTQLTMDESIPDGKQYISTCDPCCGAGCMLLAAAAAWADEEKGRIPQQDLLLVGQDLDRTVALMCYIQLSLLGYAGYVAVGDSLSNPITGTDLFPRIGKGGELWFTPGWFTPSWTERRLFEFLKLSAENPSESDRNKNLEV